MCRFLLTYESERLFYFVSFLLLTQESFRYSEQLNSWQVVFLLSVSLAAMFAHHSGLPLAGLDHPATAGRATSFVGGFLLVFGSRLAAGCPSGHGFSGMGSLAAGSFVAVAAMFAGGIGLAVLPQLGSF
jgi:uncharacterized membrane protein YedE/YeeE